MTSSRPTIAISADFQHCTKAMLRHSKPLDVGTPRFLQGLGFKALATRVWLRLVTRPP